jgi:hypothetical protein
MNGVSTHNRFLPDILGLACFGSLLLQLYLSLMLEYNCITAHRRPGIWGGAQDNRAHQRELAAPSGSVLLPLSVLQVKRRARARGGIHVHQLLLSCSTHIRSLSSTRLTHTLPVVCSGAHLLLRWMGPAATGPPCRLLPGRLPQPASHRCRAPLQPRVPVRAAVNGETPTAIPAASSPPLKLEVARCIGGAV